MLQYTTVLPIVINGYRLVDWSTIGCRLLSSSSFQSHLGWLVFQHSILLNAHLTFDSKPTALTHCNGRLESVIKLFLASVVGRSMRLKCAPVWKHEFLSSVRPVKLLIIPSIPWDGNPLDGTPEVPVTNYLKRAAASPVHLPPLAKNHSRLGRAWP
jgi:hypothetical protein